MGEIGQGFLQKDKKIKTLHLSAKEMLMNYLNLSKRPLGRSRCKWVDNIKMDLREIG
jgi:hypothetical protein